MDDIVNSTPIASLVVFKGRSIGNVRDSTIAPHPVEQNRWLACPGVSDLLRSAPHADAQLRILPTAEPGRLRKDSGWKEFSGEVDMMTLDQLQGRRGQLERELATACIGGVLDRGRIDRLSQELAITEREIEMLTALCEPRGEPATRPVVHRINSESGPIETPPSAARSLMLPHPAMAWRLGVG